MEQFKRDKNQNSNKLHLDKYYTSPELAKYCIDKTFEIIGRENITEIIEPSAGNGSFSKQIDGCIAYDLEPDDSSIIQQDYLKLGLEYRKGRLMIGNPPYGSRNILSVKFYKHSLKLGDYIAFILPISQLNNTQQMYEFELIHSENLGKRLYTDREVHCCFNIYKRPINGLNKKPNYKVIEVIEVIEVREVREVIKNQNPKRNRELNGFEYDLGICAWGASIGKEIECVGQYAKTFYIKIKDEINKQKIKQLILDTDWKNIYPMTATPNLLQWQVYKYVGEKIKELNTYKNKYKI